MSTCAVDCAMAAASSGTRAPSTVLLQLLPRRSSSGRNSLLRLVSMNLRVIHANDGRGAANVMGSDTHGTCAFALAAAACSV